MATEVKEKPGKAKSAPKPKGKAGGDMTAGHSVEMVASVRLPFLRDTKGTNVYAIEQDVAEKMTPPSPITSLYIAKPGKPGGLPKMDAITIEVYESE